MHWNPPEAWARARTALRRATARHSLRQRLALLLLPALFAVTGTELWLTRHDATEAANAAYDRSLLGALKAVDANISTGSGGLSVELPYPLFEFFELTASGQVFFRIATSDGLVELGSADLPAPPRPLSAGVPEFYDADYFGKPVRIVAYQRELDRTPAGSSAHSVLVQVGESTRSREEFSSRFVRRAALRDAIVLALLAACTLAALAAALRPLARLEREVAGRQPDDLTPLEQEAVPADIRPLVSAANRQMARTQALVAQQRHFLDDASHQLRTHLTTLQTQLDYARGETDFDAQRATLDALARELGRATRSTQQLLALGRSDTAVVQHGRFDLAELLRAVAVGLLPRARERDIDLGIHAPGEGETAEGSAMACGDRDLLHEALSNLVANALAWVPAGGTVTLYGHAGLEGWRVEVEDNGPGLSAKERASLGQRFLRGARAPAGGSGLGLAIVRSIAGRHGGTLALESRTDGPGLRAVLAWPRRAVG